MKRYKIKWLGIIAAMLFALIPQVKAQESDDLQEYLDQLAAQQTDAQRARSQVRSHDNAQSIEIPIGLTEVDLSKFTSYQNRTKTLTVKTSVKFTNGTINASSAYTGGTCLLKVYGGATVVLDATAGIDAGAASSSNCLAAVGIYEGSTFYECGDITAPNNGSGIAIYIDGASDTFIYVSGTLKGTISNKNNGTVIGIDEGGYTKAELQTMLNAIGQKLATVESLKQQAEGYYSKLDTNSIPDNIRTYVSEVMEALKPYMSQYQMAVLQYNRLKAQVQALTGKDDGTLYNQITALQTTLDTAYATINVKVATLAEQIKAKAAADLANRLAEMATRVQQQQATIYTQKEFIESLNNQTGKGDWYFQRKGTDEFNTNSKDIAAVINQNAIRINDFINGENGYNNLINNHSIASIDDIVTFYTNYASLSSSLSLIESVSQTISADLAQLQSLFNTLEVNFPDENLAFTIRPTNLNEELQLGYKSNRGFVMTSAGMMWFEQKEGADFYLTDAEGNYIVASSGSTELRTGTKDEATAWTGQSIGDGNYTFFSKTTRRYLGYNGINVNNSIIASPNAYSWTIAESELDDLQAFLNLLAEEEETSGGGSSDLTEKDTLDYVLPFFNPEQPVTPTNPFVFPKVPYPVHIIVPKDGYWPIPRPVPGQPTPKNFHPIYVPKGSHAIIDASTFRDLVGGDHIIYVEGTLEINIDIYIYINNWDWFVHVGPGGRVIWRSQPGTGDWPRIKNEGTMDIEDGGLDTVENTGTINHRFGTINWLINRYIYYFTGGLINTLNNYGQHHHQGGNVLTAKNFSGGTYTMTGGAINNTVANETDTVLINRGTFHFRGDIIGGYGRSLIYHGPGAVMRIDGGHFDFTYVKHYWIEAHSDYYIRGDYDYNPTVPVLLAPSVTIRFLYNLIFKFNIVFIGGGPTPRHPLFWGDGFTFNSNFFKYIGWDLPNKRWRWYVNEVQNTIEPRDEQVEDEDDLQAYLDWLAENQEGESASSEEEPQELDLGGKQISLTKTVNIPSNVHLRFVDCVFRPRGLWNEENVFVIPSGSSVRYEKVFFDFSSSGSYWTGNRYKQVNIFDIAGRVWIDTGCRMKGFVNSQSEPTDNYVPGTVVRVNPATGNLWLNSGDIENVIFYVSNVFNIWFSTGLSGKLWFYIPEVYLKEGFQLLSPFGDYKFTIADIRRMHVFGTKQWRVELDKQGFAALYDFFARYDMNDDYNVNGTDIQTIINFIISAQYNEKADVNKDGVVNGTDIQEIINIIVGSE
jgi:hypothetical protein